ncbi:MAG: universal stress protein [Gammaproteobacteria bacterium]|jgi:universal stress protein A
MANIVFPTDFSDVSVGALKWAVDMAGNLSAKLHCVYVVEEPQIYSTLDMGAIAIPTSGELVQSAEKRMTDFAAEYLKNIPHGCETKVVVGHAATEIVNYANEIKADMIVMTTHGYSGMKHVLLGSTTEDVLRHAGCPVLSVRAKK